MTVSYDEENAKLVDSITGKNISINGFLIPEEDWNNLEGTPKPSKDIIHPAGWSNVRSGQVVGLIDIKKSSTTKSISPIEETEPDNIELVTDSLYRVIGLSMSDSDEPFIFTTLLESTSDELIVIFSGSDAEQDSGIWSVQSEERIHDSCGCGIISDKIISQMFGTESDILSHNI